MVYALTITIAVGVLLLLLLGAGVLLARRGAGSGWLRIGRWRWYPSPLGLLVLLPLAGLLLWRLFPVLLLLPIFLPFFWRGRRLVMPFLFTRNMGRRHRPRSDGRNGDDAASIEGQYRPLDDE